MYAKRMFILIILFISTAICREYPKPIDGYFSQKGQDKFLNENIFSGKRNGIFVEIGAHDGISFSNTFFFEKNLDWSGICVEPNPDIFAKLLQNRDCACEQTCITDHIGIEPFLKCTGYMLEMYSGLLNAYDDRHLERIDKEIQIYGGSKDIIYLNCTTFNKLIEKYAITYIDLLSIDIEGGEEALIKTIDFERTKINVILIENNFNEDKIKNYLLSKGYKYITHIGKDDIYQLSPINSDSADFSGNYS